VRKGGDPHAPVGQRAGAHGSHPQAREGADLRRCAERYIEAHSPGWKNDKHIAQWESTIRMYVNPVIGKLPVDKVGVDHVMKVLEPIWTEKPETASRLRGRIEKVLGWATAMKHRSGDNPAAWDGALSHLLPPLSKVRKIEHHKAMDYREVPKLVSDLLANGSESAKALAFTILTAARTGETIGAVPAEIDVKGKLWVLPAARMKAGREHRVPLSDAAMALVPAGSGRICSRGMKPGRPLSNMAMLMLLRDLRGEGFTVHGFRSAFSTWARECTDYPREIVEACLAHASGDAVELAYRRTDFLDKRRALMEEWAGFCV
jgi:integrase